MLHWRSPTGFTTAVGPPLGWTRIVLPRRVTTADVRAAADAIVNAEVKDAGHMIYLAGFNPWNEFRCLNRFAKRFASEREPA
jgi:hypothetical protein